MGSRAIQVEAASSPGHEPGRHSMIIFAVGGYHNSDVSYGLAFASRKPLPKHITVT